MSAAGRDQPQGIFDLMTLYENVFIARQDISGQQVDALADTFTQLIADNSGDLLRQR
jgi:small subunit ribosomal protein S6